jgi:hypothetical protein
MKKHLSSFIPSAVAAGLAIGGLTASAQTLALQLKASNYNPTSGVWTDSSGNITPDNATYSGTLYPTLATGATPNGSSAVDLPGGGFRFNLATGLSGASGYTVFAYVESAATGPNAITGGNGNGGLEFRINNNQEDALREYKQDFGSASGTLTSGSFNLVDIAVSSAGGAYYLNDLTGTPDGTIAANAGFGDSILEIGNNAGNGEGFTGDIAEIDIFTGVMNSTQISAEEAALTAAYVTPVPEPTTWVMLAGGLGTLIGMRRFRRS